MEFTDLLHTNHFIRVYDILSIHPPRLFKQEVDFKILRDNQQRNSKGRKEVI